MRVKFTIAHCKTYNRKNESMETMTVPYSTERELKRYFKKTQTPLLSYEKEELCYEMSEGQVTELIAVCEKQSKKE